MRHVMRINLRIIFILLMLSPYLAKYVKTTSVLSNKFIAIGNLKSSVFEIKAF